MDKLQALSELSELINQASWIINELTKDDPDFISQQAAADMLGISRPRIGKLVKDNVLRGFNTTHTSAVYLPDVLARIEYINEHGKPTRGKAKK